MCPPFSLSGQEDCAEFCEFILNDFISSSKETENISIFQKAYRNKLEIEIKCSEFKSVSKIFDTSFILSIPTNEHSFEKNLRFIFHGKIIRYCDICQHDTE